MKLTQEALKELLNYDPDTGVFTWKVANAKRIRAGMIAGTIGNNGYWCIGINKKRFLAHRLAFLFMEGYMPENGIDHIDRNPLNNSWNNLREVSQTCNMRNKSIMKNNKSGITGIYWYAITKKWRPQITILNKKINLGSFDSLADAAKARWESEVKYNFPNCNTTSSAYMYLKENNLI